MLEDTHELAGPRKTDPVHQLRRILVYSTANRQAAANNRAAKLARGEADLDKLMRTAGSHYYPTAEAVAAKAADIARRRKVLPYLKTSITTGEDGKPVFSWSFDQAAIDTEAANDGWYALLSNLDPDDADPAEILCRYKSQPAVERRYGTIKGPPAVAPIFLQHHRRITALITIICLALLIFCLVEREVRTNLAPETDIVGFYPLDNRGMRPHRTAHPRQPQPLATPHPRPQRQTTQNPQTRLATTTTTRPTRRRHHPPPLNPSTYPMCEAQG